MIHLASIYIAQGTPFFHTTTHWIVICSGKFMVADWYYITLSRSNKIKFYSRLSQSNLRGFGMLSAFHRTVHHSRS